MEKIICALALIIMLHAQHAIAVMAPEYQNMIDLNVMISYIEENPDVSSTLKCIDFSEFTIYYGDGCRARFDRQQVSHPIDWVGPEAPLELKDVSCDEKYMNPCNTEAPSQNTDTFPGITPALCHQV